MTHEHRDHNAVELVDAPVVVRSRAGRRPYTIIVGFPLGGLRVRHLGDFGQAALRPERLVSSELAVEELLARGAPTTVALPAPPGA